MPARLRARSSSLKPSGSTRWRVVLVAAQRRAKAPVLGGLSGSTRTMWRLRAAGMGSGLARIADAHEIKAAGGRGGGGFGAEAGAEDFAEVVGGDFAEA